MKAPLLQSICSCLLLSLLVGCKPELDKEKVLQEVLTNLENIHSASYYSIASVSQPGDTVEYNTFNRYTKEYLNIADPTIGSTYVSLHADDTTRVNFFYDGSATGHLNWERKTISIDSFQNNTLGFRPVGPPFFNYTKSIIKYALETDDSISIDVKDFGDSLLFTLKIFGEVVEFFGNDRWYTEHNSSHFFDRPDLSSEYDIWIRRSTLLPFRKRRKMPHNTSFETVDSVKLNKSSLSTLKIADYFPSDFIIRSKDASYKRIRESQQQLIGSVAPDWILKNANGENQAFKDLQSKVVVIQFTGIGCGPCHQSISFLKQLVNEYKSKDFEFVALEGWAKNIAGLKRYQDRNELNFKFLKSEPETTRSYLVHSVPVFYVLDEKRVIRKIISGYSKGETDMEIVGAVEELL